MANFYKNSYKSRIELHNFSQVYRFYEFIYYYSNNRVRNHSNFQTFILHL